MKKLKSLHTLGRKIKSRKCYGKQQGVPQNTKTTALCRNPLLHVHLKQLKSGSQIHSSLLSQDFVITLLHLCLESAPRDGKRIGSSPSLSVISLSLKCPAPSRMGSRKWNVREKDKNVLLRSQVRFQFSPNLLPCRWYIFCFPTGSLHPEPVPQVRQIRRRDAFIKLLSRRKPFSNNLSTFHFTCVSWSHKPFRALVLTLAPKSAFT